MYEKITRDLYNFAEQLKTINDCTAVPLDEVASLAGAMLDNIGLDSAILYRTLQEQISKAVERNDVGGLKSAILMLTLLIESGDKAMAYGRLAESYKDVVVHRMPEYNYLKNKERLAKYYEKHERRIAKPFVGKGCIYTVLTGCYDDILSPAFIDRDLDYLILTDNHDLKAEGWRVIHISNPDGLDPVLLSRHPKILPYYYLNDYEYALYIDANIQITGDIKQLIELYSTGEPMLCLNHHINADIYEEADLCVENGRGDSEQIRKQITLYEAVGFPHDYGLTQNGFLLRNLHDIKLKKVMQDWWEELIHHSKRDQLSLTYCCWKNDFMYDSCPISIADNPYFEIHAHK